MRRITDEIWNERRRDLIDELIAEDLVDHVDMPGLEGFRSRPVPRFGEDGAHCVLRLPRADRVRRRR
jgi:hypothetical protein